MTVDAMGCQKRIAQRIIQQGGDYVLSLKGNQGNLHEDVATYFISRLSPEAAMVTVDGGHGRIETRAVCVTDEIAGLKERPAWAGLHSIIAVTAARESINKITGEIRYFISSLSANNPAKLEHAVRAHWAIGNHLHGVLDIAFDEESNRIRKGHSAANLATIGHSALNLINKENIKSRCKNKTIKGRLG